MSDSGKRVVVTGGAGFIGRWLVADLLERGHHVRAFDDCSSGAPENLAEFEGTPGYEGLVVGDVKDRSQVETLLGDDVDVCFHLAARINVQHSIDDPRSVLENDVLGAFNVLEAARQEYLARQGLAIVRGAAVPEQSGGSTDPSTPKVVFVSTCMVYTPSDSPEGISEEHDVGARSPYAACKLAGEHLALGYFHAYGLPVTILRPFNTFGPYQRTDTEGGVVAVFLERALAGEPLLIRGDGCQTRDLLYVEDCARFIADAGLNPAADGLIINAGRGADISINELAERIARGRSAIHHVAHDHPQAEIARLRCNNTNADRLLGWKPRYGLDEAIAATEAWIRRTRGTGIATSSAGYASDAILATVTDDDDDRPETPTGDHAV